MEYLQSLQRHYDYDYDHYNANADADFDDGDDDDDDDDLYIYLFLDFWDFLDNNLKTFKVKMGDLRR